MRRIIVWEKISDFDRNRLIQSEILCGPPKQVLFTFWMPKTQMQAPCTLQRCVRSVKWGVLGSEN